MKLKEGYKKLKKLENKTFGMLNLDCELLNKGRAGQLLETKIGLKSGNHHLDFEDGELKSHKCELKNTKIVPKETIALTIISSNNVDDYLESSFSKSLLGSKISNLLLVPVIKVKEKKGLVPFEWFVKNVTLFKSKKFQKELEEDYDFIISKIKTSKKIKTTSGPNDYLQIRSKDSRGKKTKKYHEVYSKHLDIKLSDKNYAFYLKKSFIKKLINR